MMLRKVYEHLQILGDLSRMFVKEDPTDNYISKKGHSKQDTSLIEAKYISAPDVEQTTRLYLFLQAKTMIQVETTMTLENRAQGPSSPRSLLIQDT